MKTLNRQKSQGLSSHRRGGVTLVEVLMSLMIMGIGVVSLATLFPISTLRILDATNLTNSTVVRFNAEGIVDSFPGLIHNPDNDNTTREAGRPYIVDPLGWLEHQQQLGLPGNDPILRYFEYNRPSAATLPLLVSASGAVLQSRFLGENPASPVLFTSLDIARAIVGLPDTATSYGDTFPDPTGANAAAYGLNSSNRIQSLVLPPELDMSVFTLAPTDPNYRNPLDYQVLIFDKSGDFSEIRRLTTVAAAGGGWQISWEQDLNGNGSIDPGEELPLPQLFTVTQDAAALPNVGRVRVEQPVPYYSWLLTVRKRASGPANVDVVVFNGRDFSQLSEQVYLGELRRFDLGLDGAPGEAGVDDNGDGQTDEVAEIGYPFRPGISNSDDQPNSRVMISWDPSFYTTTALKPPMKRGGYIYDPLNGLWYRIRGIESADFDGDGTNENTSATLLLEESIKRNNTEDINLNGALDLTGGNGTGEDTLAANGTLDRGGVIIPKGVVAVFPLETKLP